MTAVVAPVVAAAAVLLVVWPTSAARTVAAGAPRRRAARSRVRRGAAGRGHGTGSHRRNEARLDRAMPDLLDLLVVGLSAGLPVQLALEASRSAAPDAVRPAVDATLRRLERGDRRTDALDALVEHLGTRALALVGAITASWRDGLPLAPTIDRLADDARAHRRRLAEADARRVPVRLSVPLVCFSLPSFVCLSIGPLVIGALSSLRTP